MFVFGWDCCDGAVDGVFGVVGGSKALQFRSSVHDLVMWVGYYGYVLNSDIEIAHSTLVFHPMRDVKSHKRYHPGRGTCGCTGCERD